MAPGPTTRSTFTGLRPATPRQPVRSPTIWLEAVCCLRQSRIERASMSVAEPTGSTVSNAVEAFLASLAGKSPRTRATYASALRRLEEFLDWAGYPPATTLTEKMPPDLLERFYTWLVSVYGRDHRSTMQTYVAG